MNKFDILYQSIMYSDSIYYHISPFKFDRFDLNKCGSGMGTSFWGYGIYLCKSEGIIDYYYDQMKDSYSQLFKYTVKVNSAFMSEQLKKYMNGIRNKQKYVIDNSIGHLYQQNDLLVDDKTVGEKYYQLVEADNERIASKIMRDKYHVDGIAYYTQQDGNSLVIYNDKVLQILDRVQL